MLRSAATFAALLATTLGANSMPSRSYAYQDTIAAPGGQQQSVAARITITPQTNGTIQVAVTANGRPTVTTTFSASEPAPAPRGSSSPQQAQGALILQRVAMLAQIRKAMLTKAPIAVHIPILTPGASATQRLPAELIPSESGTKLEGSASIATTATMPSHVKVPDQVMAVVHADLQGGVIGELSGTVTHALNVKGEITTLNESWQLSPTH